MRLRSTGCMARVAIAPMCVAALTASGVAVAFDIDIGSQDARLSWDNNVKYSAAWRLHDPTTTVAGDPTTAQVNTNDGDLNFDKGLISNRLDLLSAIDFRYRKMYGMRLSGQAWYDTVYHSDTDNPGNQGINQISSPADEFVNDTEKLHGGRAELMDAFVYGNFVMGDKRLNVKGGRFTQLYGESLFFGSNAVAAAQTPLDLTKALSVPNAQFKEVARPAGQVSAQLQLNARLTLGAYYQLEWRKTRLPGAGSYWSFSDFADKGGERLLLGPDLWVHRGDDMEAKDSGQGGMQLRLKAGDSEYGLYAAIFHDKMPQFYARPGVNAVSANDIGDYLLVYGEDIRLFGASVSTLIGETNVAAEVSYRDNMPLAATGATAIVGPDADNNRHPAYPVGRTLHLNASAISVLGESPIWDGASFIGEFAFNRVVSHTDNKDAVDPLATRNASAAQLVFQPEYFQVLPGLDLQLPIGLTYGISGRSAVNGVLFPSHHGGTLNVGVKGSYRKLWSGSVNYSHYFGADGAIIRPAAAPALSYNNFYGDRDYISVSIERAF